MTPFILIISVIILMASIPHVAAITITSQIHKCIFNNLNKYATGVGLLSITNSSAVFDFLKNNENMTVTNIENCIQGVK